ncbi:MAG: hypothetical protein IIA44_12495 [Acidobacteria bacterium]|nr:hypothetical protein [Acidobacteriota bacterium]
MDVLLLRPEELQGLITMGEAIDIVADVQPKRALLTHMMHRIDHRCFREQCAEHGARLPGRRQPGESFGPARRRIGSGRIR